MAGNTMKHKPDLDATMDEQLALLRARMTEAQWEEWVAQVERSYRRVKSFYRATRPLNG